MKEEPPAFLRGSVSSPESLADSERMRAKIEEDIATGNVKNYLMVDDLEKYL